MAINDFNVTLTDETILIANLSDSQTFNINLEESAINAPVSSVFGRTGAITSQSGDYNLDQITQGSTNKYLSSTDYTDLTDSGDSTLHYHVSDRLRANHTGTQLASTISDFTTATQTVSDSRYLKLDASNDPIIGDLSIGDPNDSAELITNQVDRDFSGATNWTGTNWAIVSGALKHTTGSTAAAVLNNSFLTSESIKNVATYKVTLTISGRTNGTVQVRLNPTNSGTQLYSADGTYTGYLVSGGNNANLELVPSSTFDGSIDNISFVKVNTAVFFDSNNGYVGYGTANPLRRFTIASPSDGNVTAQAFYNYSTADNGGVVISFRTDTTNTGATAFTELAAIRTRFTLHDHATRASDMSFFTANASGGTERLRIEGNGNVGIGNAATVATSRLFIVGAASSITSIFRANATTPGNLTEWQSSAGAILSFINSAGGAVFNEVGGDTDVRIEGDTDTNLFFTDASADRVGIGTNTPNSKLQVVGSLALPYIARTTGYTITANDYTVDCTSGTFTVTLPTAVGITGRIYNIKNSGAGTITVDGNASETIDGMITQNVLAGSNMQIQSTGTNWIIL